VPVHLVEGANLLVLKVMQALRGWEFVARFEDNTGLAAHPSGVAAEARDLPGPGDMPGRPPKIVNGPYLQHLGTDAATIMWQTDIPSVGTLAVERESANAGVMLEEPRRLHEVRVTGLVPDATYTYSVISRSESGNEGETASGPDYRFQTFAAEKEPFTFVVYGDNRSLPDRHAAVVNRILADVGDRAAFLLNTGDLIGDGRDLAQWIPEFFGPAQPLIRRVCLYPVLGNHEGNSQFYFMFFDLPEDERWYSFDYLDAHFIALDSNADMNPGSEQYQWLVNDLVANRDATWKVVYLHHPPYTSGPHGGVSEDGVPHEKGVRHGRQHLAPLFASEEVDVVFAGHDHCYERSHYGNVVYVTSGGGGAPLYDPVNAHTNPGSAIFVKAWHYVEANVDDETFSWVARDADGNEIDRYELRQ
jgi:3',5'-cyclic AMP phosphodiesterase CpdA